MVGTFDAMVEAGADIPTWFGVGGRADLLCRPSGVEELRDALLAFAHAPVRVLGDGANLLVHDDGVDGLVVSLDRMRGVEEVLPVDGGDPDFVLLRAQAGAPLPKLVVDTVRDGLSGLEVLAGVPATVGGAAVMNAGGGFGSIGDVIYAVHAVTRSGEAVTIPYAELSFDYRHSGLSHLIVTAVDLALRPVEPDERPALRDRLKEIMAWKSKRQPMAERSAGCVFKNPLVDGERMSAGKLIDASGCKGMTAGGAAVSPVHANFFTTSPGCTAQDVVTLMDRVRERVHDRFDVTLEPEIIVWRRSVVRDGRA